MEYCKARRFEFRVYSILSLCLLLLIQIPSLYFYYFAWFSIA